MQHNAMALRYATFGFGCKSRRWRGGESDSSPKHSPPTAFNLFARDGRLRPFELTYRVPVQP